MSRWWRAYDDALHDPKVQSLPPVLFKFWFNLLCVASKYDGLIPPLSELKALLKARSDHIEHHLQDLLRRGLIDDKDGCFEPHNWQKRQYKSDLSTPRVQQYRNAKCNVSETPPDNRVQITDTEKIKPLSETSSDATKRKRISYPEEFENFWRAYPTDPLQSKKEAFSSWKRLSDDDRTQAARAAPAFRRYCNEHADYRPVHACRFLSQRRFEGFTGNTGRGPPPGLSGEERAAWVRAQMEKDREKNSATTQGFGKLLEAGQRVRAS